MKTTADSPPHGFRAWGTAHWCAVWVAVFVSAAICWRVQRAHLANANRELVEQERSCQSLVDAEARIAEIGARAAAISRREVAIEQLRSARHPMTLLGTIGRAAANQVAVEELELSLEGRGPLRLKVLGSNDAAIQRFIGELQSSAEFAAMELKMTMSPRTAAAVREFDIEGRLH